MQHARGFLMIGAAAVAFWKAWMIHQMMHRGPQVGLAVGLGVLALGMAAWHFTQKPAAPKPSAAPQK
ncbi:hypothetical protein ACOBR2_20750 [Telmatobacter bradus]|uniref:hypothetical protein n=1 Tax=Telmatobacter bradus TaxID=474953 RepID=UPI003B43AA29